MTMSSAQGLALIRAAFGLYFVISALRKLSTGWLDSGEPVTGFVTGHLEAATPLYRGFLESAVLPNADRFAQLIVFGEVVAGLCLLLGFCTRLGALVGMWLVLNFMLTKGLADFDGSQDRLFFASCAVFALSAAGLVWGLDGVLRPHLDVHPLTRWLAGIPRRPRVLPRAIPAQRHPRPGRVRRSA